MKLLFINSLRDVADILLISAIILVFYVIYRRYKIKIAEKKRAQNHPHFSFVDFFYNAKYNYWQLMLQLYVDEEICIVPLDDNNQEVENTEKIYQLKKGKVTINLESPDLKNSKFVKVSSKNKSFVKRMPA
mgnify:CR=1 FL=1